MKRLLPIFVAAFVAMAAPTRADGPAVETAPLDGELPSDPHQLLECAFDRMFNYASVRTVYFDIQSGGRRVTRRAFEVAYAREAGKGHSLLRFLAPAYLRNNAVRMIENGDGSTDVWIYRQEDGRPRRVSVSQKGDAFYGSHFTYEDLEHHDWKRFYASIVGRGDEQGRPSWVLEARPKETSQYSLLRVWVEQEREALLRVDFFRTGKRRVKSLIVDATSIVESNGILKATRMAMVPDGRDGATQVRFERIEPDPTLSPKDFRMSLLLQEGSSLYRILGKGPEVAALQAANCSQSARAAR